MLVGIKAVGQGLEVELVKNELKQPQRNHR